MKTHKTEHLFFRAVDISFDQLFHKAIVVTADAQSVPLDLNCQYQRSQLFHGPTGRKIATETMIESLFNF